MMAIVNAAIVSHAGAFTKFSGAEGEKMSGKSTSSQEFTLKEEGSGKTIAATCAHAEGESVIKGVKTEFASGGHYKECKVAGIAATVKGEHENAKKERVKCETVQHINGTVDLIGESPCTTIEVAATKCKVIVNEQKAFKEITYKNGVKGELIGEGKVTGVKWESATGKACGFEKEATKGTANYQGSAEIAELKVE